MSAAVDLAARARKRLQTQITRARRRLHLETLDPGPVALSSRFRPLVDAGGKSDLVARYRDRFAEEAVHEIAAADRLLRHEFELLGHSIRFDGAIDWSRDPVSGKTWSHGFSQDIPYRGPDRLGDIKLPWELSKHQYFITLGKASWLTGNPRYSREIAAQIEDWIAANPCHSGIHWISALEAGTRVLSWMLAWPFFAADCDGGFRALVLRSMAQHLLFVERNLSLDSHPNTHLAGEAAILVAGALFLECGASERWMAIGMRHLETQIRQQVREDGVHAEQSVAYHRFFLDHYYLVDALLRANGRSFSGPTLERLERMTGFLMDVMHPDGSVPAIGDGDDARGIWCHADAARDYRGLLALGALRFRRGDFKHVCGRAAEELLWLGGTQALREFDALSPRPPDHTSRAYRDSGYYVLRSGWAAADSVLLFDCGPLGHGPAGHGHADALAFHLHAAGHSFLVDAGTYSYNLDYARRQAFRATRAHNTIVVDGQDQSVQRDRMSWAQQANVRCLRWVSTGDYDLLEAEHDGYRRLPDPVVHRRTIVFLKPDVWIVCDRIIAARSSGPSDQGAGEREHSIEWFLHLAPDCAVSDPNSRTRERSIMAPNGARLRFGWCSPFKDESDESSTRLEVITDWISERYGSQTEAPALRVAGTLRAESGAEWTIAAWFSTAADVSPRLRGAGPGLKIDLARPGAAPIELMIPAKGNS